MKRHKRVISFYDYSICLIQEYLCRIITFQEIPKTLTLGLDMEFCSIRDEMRAQLAIRMQRRRKHVEYIGHTGIIQQEKITVGQYLGTPKGRGSY